jgi:hypothetical protein
MEKKIYLFNALARLTPDNVSEIYNIELNKWRYLNSSEVAINGEAVSDSIEKQLLMLPDEKGEPNIKDCTVNDRDASGFELDEQLFIDEQIAKYKPLLDKSKGSAINRGAHLKIRAYIEYLENLAEPKEPIVDEMVLSLIYRKYGFLFEAETEKYWLNRFVHDGIERTPIKVQKKTKGDNDKAHLLVILHLLNKHDMLKKTAPFDINDFVETNFGIKNFTKTYFDYKSNYETDCNRLSDEIRPLL